MKECKISVSSITETAYSKITTNEIQSATSEFSNWKSPGLDKFHNFCWSKLTTLHPKVASAFDKLIAQPENCRECLITGQATLMAKKKPTRNPSNYKLITCLPVMYLVKHRHFPNAPSYRWKAKSYRTNEKQMRAILMAQPTSSLSKKW